uniref:Uncharacterized protein n=1 Tax=Populus davidiana TaxID=266767 RepID=A0A6M2E7X0_9ROSI
MPPPPSSSPPVFPGLESQRVRLPSLLLLFSFKSSLTTRKPEHPLFLSTEPQLNQISLGSEEQNSLSDLITHLHSTDEDRSNSNRNISLSTVTDLDRNYHHQHLCHRKKEKKLFEKTKGIDL